MKKIKEFATKNAVIYPLMVGLSLRLFGLTRSSIWHDEGYTMWLLRYNFSEIIARTVRDVHPPFYYLVSKVWVSVFGTSVFSIRFLSLLFSIGIIYFAYRTVEMLFSKRAAFWTGMLLAFSPFMIRFGQEARMYGVVAFFATLASYLLVRFIKEKKLLYLFLYVLSMVAAVYTQYYAFFVVISHWLIMLLYTPGVFKTNWLELIKKKAVVFDWRWWVANASILVFYLPWFGVAYKQVTRVSGSYWIRPEWITIKTIPGNVLQFIFYSHFDTVAAVKYIGPVIYWLVVVTVIGATLFMVLNKEVRKKVFALAIYGYVPMILVFTLSKLKTPVYQDRYFPFSAVALFALWGVGLAAIKQDWARRLLGAMAVLMLCGGIYIMRFDVNHQMKRATDIVKQNMRPGDIVLSGELYTFLDSSYYLGYGNIKLISEKVDGYGETSLFYDQQDGYIVNPRQTRSLGPRVWVIGKTGDKDYFSNKLWAGTRSKEYMAEAKSNGLRVILYTR